MNKENTDEIMAADPVFYRERDMDCTKTNMCWGFECGDGWKRPLLELAKKTSILNGLLAPLNMCIVGKQVKSKFADLRVYWDMQLLEGDDAPELNGHQLELVKTVSAMMDDAVNSAESECEVTCEECGFHGNGLFDEIVTCGGWLTHYCRTCAQRWQRESGRVTNYREGFEYLSPFVEGKIYDGDEKYGCFMGLYYSKLHPEMKSVFRNIANPRDVQAIAVDMGLVIADESALAPMREALELKFADERMKKRLLDTDGLELCGMNRCHENFWGGCACEKCRELPHLNHYGELLMEIRNRLK